MSMHWEDTDSYSADNDSRSTCSWQHEPIVVGYAFGPKKMTTMGVVMAEASRVEVIHEEEEELFYGDHEQERPIQRKTPQSTLTSAALEGLETNSKHQNSTIISLGNSNDTNLKHIIRYFRSSCSLAAASMCETTVSTPTTATTFTSRRQKFPVRISFVPLDPDLPLEEQHGGNFDLILHKLTEDILSCSLEDHNKEASWKRIQTLKVYQSLNANCCLVDDPSHVQTLMSRSDIAHVLQNCLQGVTSASGIPIKAPKFVVVQEDTCNLLEGLQCQQLAPPLIVKPLVAAGTKQSHYMTIILQDSALSQVPPKSLIQEYVNHNATLYKVYVLGENFYIYQRPSLPNLPSPLHSSMEMVEFDSQRPYPRLQDFGINQEETTTIRVPPPTTMSREEVLPIVDALKEAFGLELFGFDILMGDNEWLVVDVNYFPSYKEVPNFPLLLAQYLTQRVLEQRRLQR